MKHLILVLTVLCSFSVFSQTNIIGTWNTGQNNAKIEIADSSNTIMGKIISSDNPEAKIGQVLLTDLKKEGTHWKGKIYSPKREQWYEAEFFPNENILKIEINIGFFSKTIEWKKERT